MKCRGSCDFRTDVVYENSFKIHVHNHGTEIDPDDEQDWYSLTLGWALAKGLSIEQSHKFATHIRYHTDLG